MINSRVFGGILLVAGTTIGAGMLALPAVCALGGFFPSLILLLGCWLLMLTTAFFFLDANLAVRGEPNMISMAGKTLGLPGRIVCWVVYLLLLYSLTAAYIAGSAPLFTAAVHALIGLEIPSSIAAFLLPLLCGGCIYFGTQRVDYLNRILMVGLIVAYLVLVGFLPQHLQTSLFLPMSWSKSYLALPVVITSFGYHIIIPTLTTYLNHNAKQLRLTILIGSILPLIVYVIWLGLTMGVVPQESLVEALHEGKAATEPLRAFLQKAENSLIGGWVGNAARFFSFFAIITSFLGVALSLSDFLADGFKIKRNKKGKLIASALTFLPPLLFVFIYEKGFYLALNYAGAFVAILLGILPALMAWTLKTPRFYRTFLGRTLLLLVMLLSLGVIIIDVL